MGATSRQIRKIYLVYFTELMLGSLFFAFILASVILISFNLLNHKILSIQAMLGFSLRGMPQVFWYGLSIEIFIVAIVMLGLAPLCVLINRKRIG